MMQAIEIYAEVAVKVECKKYAEWCKTGVGICFALREDRNKFVPETTLLPSVENLLL